MKGLSFTIIILLLFASSGCRSCAEKEEPTEEAKEMFRENMKKDFIGKAFPDFTLPDIDGNAFILSEYSDDKYLVLDFWGSWCGACIAEFPEMKSYYEKHRSRVEFISINIDDGVMRWKRAVKKHELPWLQLRDDQLIPESSPRYLLGIYLFPTTIILSPDKTVLNIFKGEGPELYETLDELLK
ncbi:MAG: TlpA family protein disulfide reductase [Prevotellaceae bacterium]|jgi:thiol-disulfide isomerase/thioredoxin|nr:TlpA family protein disulfide reductase [Prevotellaceae bacterium]